MQLNVSRCVCIQHPDAKRLVEFYRDVIGLRMVDANGSSIELAAGPLRLFIDQGDHLGPIIEFIVPDVEQARQELLAAGCTVVRWEGAGSRCYVRDPFGIVFNLFEDRQAFEEGEYDAAGGGTPRHEASAHTIETGEYDSVESDTSGPKGDALSAPSEEGGDYVP